MSDSGQGSEAAGAEDQPLAANSNSAAAETGAGEAEPEWLYYHFQIPGYLCGKFIGVGGSNVKTLKAQSGCHIYVKNDNVQGAVDREHAEFQLCSLEGTREAINKALEIIRHRYPMDQHPRLTLEQTNLPEGMGGYHGNDALSPAAALISEPRRVQVTAIVSANRVFVQQPFHPMQRQLARLEQCMEHVYSPSSNNGNGAPLLTEDDLQVGLLCVTRYSDGRWYRAQVVAFRDMSSVSVRSVDYGGYETLHLASLRKIRSDFLALPFLAVECLLANVSPLGGGSEWSIEAAQALEKIVANKICTAFVVGYGLYNAPFVQLFALPSATVASAGADPLVSLEGVNVSKELVESGVAAWQETAATGEAELS